MLFCGADHIRPGHRRPLLAQHVSLYLRHREVFEAKNICDVHDQEAARLDNRKVEGDYLPQQALPLLEGQGGLIALADKVRRRPNTESDAVGLDLRDKLARITLVDDVGAQVRRLELGRI